MIQFQGELTFGRTRLHFSVAEGVTSVSITGTTVTKGFLYAAAYDAKEQFRGKILFEKQHKSLDICIADSGLGAIDGALPSGEWYIDLYNLEGEFRSERAMQYMVAVEFDKPVPKSELELVNSVTFDHEVSFDYSRLLNLESRWYRGDLHAHTQLSDGHNTLEAAKEIVEQQGLDFFFFTEHNMCQPKLPVSEQCLFLPALEVTTDLGHFNVHGAARNLDLRNVEHSSQAIIEAGLKLAKKGQSSVSINHPMMKPWHWHYDAIQLSDVSTFEVCCDPTWSTSPKSTDLALEVLSAMWNNGHRIAAVGGSDSHLQPHERNPKATEPSIYGDPSTYVFSHGLSGEGILSGLTKGHVYLERQCGLEFTINHGAFIPGSDTLGEPLQYSLAVKDTSLDYYAECIVDGKVVERLALSNQPQTIDVEGDYAWCRVDIRRGDVNSKLGTGEFEACINPVFNSDKTIFSESTVSTWGELMEQRSSDEV